MELGVSKLLVTLVLSGSYALDLDDRSVMIQLSLADEECEICTSSREKWDSLIVQFRESDEVLVARLECDSAKDEALCLDLFDELPMVISHPCVIFGSPYSLGVWYGGRDYDSLYALASSLRAPCSPMRRNRCDQAQLEEIDTLSALDMKDLNRRIARESVRVDDQITEIFLQIENKREQVIQRLEAYQVIADQDLSKLEQEISLAKSVARARSDNACSLLRNVSPVEVQDEAYSNVDLFALFYDDYFDTELDYDLNEYGVEDSYYKDFFDDIYSSSGTYNDYYYHYESGSYAPPGSRNDRHHRDEMRQSRKETETRRTM